MTANYVQDFYGWTQEQAALLRAGRLSELDIGNLLEEVEAMGRGERKELASPLEVLLTHLLKWRFQPARRGNSWQSTIREQRKRIADHVMENPSLSVNLEEIFAKAYGYAIDAAERETGLGADAFPTECPWTFADAVNRDFWPE
jgi:ribosomal protein L29